MQYYRNELTGDISPFTKEVAKRLPTVIHNGKRIQPWKLTKRTEPVQSQEEIQKILEEDQKVKAKMKADLRKEVEAEIKAEMEKDKTTTPASSKESLTEQTQEENKSVSTKSLEEQK